MSEVLLLCVHPLRDQAEDGNGAHEEDCVVELYTKVSGLSLPINAQVRVKKDL